MADALGRRDFLKMMGATSIAAGLSIGTADGSEDPSGRIPIIDITDLYHPHQDCGDNLDLIAAYGLPEIDLRAVVLDVTQEYRRPNDPAQKPDYRDSTGPRDPGVIPVTQLNYIFDRNVPFGVGPFTRLREPGDKALDLPKFQQSGVELILKTLRESKEKVEILSFGSARPLAAAYNREPKLLKEKVRRVHLCAGASSPDFTEWNVMLDPNAIVCLMRSDLPIAVCPCATGKGPFDIGPNNSYCLLPDLDFIRRMDPMLQRYLAYVFERSTRPDFLNALEDEVPAEVMDRICKRRHSVWETAVWAQVSRRKLVRRDGGYRLITETGITAADIALPNDLVPCKIDVRNDGRFSFEKTKGPSNFLIYDRGDAELNQRAMREALPALYEAFRPSHGR